jgi:hypothetical protein
MPDPFGIPTRRDPTYRFIRRGSTMIWAFAAVVAVIILGIAFFGMNTTNTRTAVNPETTVGQRSQADPPATTTPRATDRAPPSSTTGQANSPNTGNNSIGQQQPR